MIQDGASHEATQETLALFKIPARGNREIDPGMVKPVSDVMNRLRAKDPAPDATQDPAERDFEEICTDIPWT